MLLGTGKIYLAILHLGAERTFKASLDCIVATALNFTSKFESGNQSIFGVHLRAIFHKLDRFMVLEKNVFVNEMVLHIVSIFILLSFSNYNDYSSITVECLFSI